MKTLLFIASLIVSASASCCPSGWNVTGDHSRCFKMSTNRLSWPDAARDCQKMQGQLVSIHNAFDNNMIFALMPRGDPDHGFWIGATTPNPRAGDTADWYWLDGSAMDYQNWSSGNPNADTTDHSQPQACMQIWSFIESEPGKWDDQWCETAELFVCETPSSGIFCTRQVI